MSATPSEALAGVTGRLGGEDRPIIDLIDSWARHAVRIVREADPDRIPEVHDWTLDDLAAALLIREAIAVGLADAGAQEPQQLLAIDELFRRETVVATPQIDWMQWNQTEAGPHWWWRRIPPTGLMAAEHESGRAAGLGSDGGMGGGNRPPAEDTGLPEAQAELERLGNLEEALLHDVRWRGFGTEVHLVFDVIQNADGTVRDNRVASRPPVVLRCEGVQRVLLDGDLTTGVLDHPDRVDWGLTEVAAVRLDRFPLLDRMGVRVHVKWEGRRQIEVQAARVRWATDDGAGGRILGVGLEAFLPRFERRMGMYLLWSTFPEVCAFLNGYEAGSGGEVMAELQRWLSSRSDRPELAYMGQVARELFGRDGPNLRDLTPEQDKQATEALFRLLRQHLDDG